MTTNRKVLQLDFNKIRDDLYTKKPLDLTPMLDAIRAQDRESVIKLVTLGFRLSWIDDVRKKNVIRILADEGNEDAIRFLFNIISFGAPLHSAFFDLMPHAIQGALFGKHQALLAYLKSLAHSYGDGYFAKQIRIAEAVQGKLPTNDEIEEYLRKEDGSFYLADILYYLSLNGKTTEAIKLIDEYVLFKANKKYYFNREAEYNSIVILQDLMLNHACLLVHLVKGAVHDDKFKPADIRHLRADELPDIDLDIRGKKQWRDFTETFIAEAVASAGKTFQSSDYYACKNEEKILCAAISSAISSGHYHDVLRLCDQAKQLCDDDKYFRVLVKAARSAMVSDNMLLAKLILRRFPDNFKFENDKCSWFSTRHEDLQKLSQCINDPVTYLSAVHILFSANVDKASRDFQNELGIPDAQQLTPVDLKSLFSNRSIIQFILLNLDTKYSMMWNHDMMSKMIAKVSDHKLSEKQIKLLKEVVRNNKKMFCGTVARKRIPEPQERFHAYLEKYNFARGLLLLYLSTNGRHCEKAKIVLEQLDKAVNIAEIKALFHDAINSSWKYGWYEFISSHVLSDDLTPILRQCLDAVNSEVKVVDEATVRLLTA